MAMTTTMTPARMNTLRQHHPAQSIQVYRGRAHHHMPTSNKRVKFTSQHAYICIGLFAFWLIGPTVFSALVLCRYSSHLESRYQSVKRHAPFLTRPTCTAALMQTIIFADSWLASHESVSRLLSVVCVSVVCYIRELWLNGAR